MCNTMKYINVYDGAFFPDMDMPTISSDGGVSPNELTAYKFTCTVASSNPAVTSYNWFKDGAPQTTTNTNEYSIPSITRQQNGVWTCEGTITQDGVTIVKKSSNSITLKVFCKL